MFTYILRCIQLRKWSTLNLRAFSVWNYQSYIVNKLRWFHFSSETLNVVTCLSNSICTCKQITTLLIKIHILNFKILSSIIVPLDILAANFDPEIICLQKKTRPPFQFIFCLITSSNLLLFILSQAYLLCYRDTNYY